MSFTPKTPAEADAYAAGFRAGYEARIPTQQIGGNTTSPYPLKSSDDAPSISDVICGRPMKTNVQAKLAGQESSHLIQGQASATSDGFYG